MKKKRNLSNRLKQAWLAKVLLMPIPCLICIILGINFCINIPVIWYGILLIVFGVVLAVGIVFAIRKYLKEQEEQEEEEAERARLEFLAREAIQMRARQEENSPKTIDVNDRDDVI